MELEETKFRYTALTEAAAGKNRHATTLMIVVTIVLGISASLSLSSKVAIQINTKREALIESVSNHGSILRLRMEQIELLNIEATRESIQTFEELLDEETQPNSYPTPLSAAGKHEIACANKQSILTIQSDKKWISQKLRSENPTIFVDFLDISVPASGWTSRKDNRARFNQIIERYGFDEDDFAEESNTDQQLMSLERQLQKFEDCSPLFDAYQDLVRIGANLPQVFFADVEHIPSVRAKFLELLAVLEIRNPRVLVVGGQVSNSQVFTGLSVPSSPAELTTPNEDYLASTFGPLFDYANAIARNREELLLGGAAASAYGVSFNLPVSPFCLVAPLVAALFFLGISAAIQQRNEYRTLATGTLRSLDNGSDEHSYTQSLRETVGMKLSQVAENSVFVGFSIVYFGLMAVLVFASYEITNKGWAFRWLTGDFDGWWIFYPWVLIVVAIHIAALPILLPKASKWLSPAASRLRYGENDSR